MSSGVCNLLNCLNQKTKILEEKINSKDSSLWKYTDGYTGTVKNLVPKDVKNNNNSYQVDSIVFPVSSTEGTGNFMMYNSLDGSFRVGGVTGNEWTSSNRGEYSSVLSYNSSAEGKYSAVLGGFSNNARSEGAVIIGARNSEITNTLSNSNGGIRSAIVGGVVNKITSLSSVIGGGFLNEDNGLQANFISGAQNKINEGSYNSIVGGFNGKIGSTGNTNSIIQSNSILSGSTNRISENSTNSIIIQNGIITGFNNLISGGNNGQTGTIFYSNILGGSSNKIGVTGGNIRSSNILGGNNNKIIADNTELVSSSIIGGDNNKITSNINTFNHTNGILLSKDSSIGPTSTGNTGTRTDNNIIMGGQNQNIISNSTTNDVFNNLILGGNNNTVNNKANVSLIGSRDTTITHSDTFMWNGSGNPQNSIDQGIFHMYTQNGLAYTGRTGTTGVSSMSIPIYVNGVQYYIDIHT